MVGLGSEIKCKIMICNNDVLEIFLKVFTKQFPLVFLCTNQGPSSKKVRRTIIFMNGAFVNMQLAVLYNLQSSAHLPRLVQMVKDNEEEGGLPNGN